MDMSENNYQSIDNNCLCDGYGCYSKDISELQVKVKETRTFFLSIGENCRTKFNDRNWMETERNYIAYPGAKTK